MVTHPDNTAAENVAYRRAAYRLEQSGQLVLASVRVAGGPPRLAAFRPAADIPAQHSVLGLDRKRYRQPLH